MNTKLKFNKLKFSILVLLLIFGFEIFLYSAFTNNRIFNTRAKGMGSAFTAVANDSGALIYNTAGLGKLSFYELYLLYSDLYYGLDGVDISDEYASFICPIKKMGSVGVSYSEFKDKDLYYENMINLSYGKELFYNLNAGLGVSYLKHGYKPKNNISVKEDPVFTNIDSKDAFGINLGLLYDIKHFSIGASANNINRPDVGLKDKDIVPTDYRLGCAFKYENFTVPLDLSYRDQSWGGDFKDKLEYAVGLEYWLTEGIGVRGGYNTNELALGFSFMKNKIFSNVDTGLEYSLTIPRELNDTIGSHQFSLFFRFGQVATTADAFVKDKLKFYQYDKIHPKFSSIQGLSAYSDKVADLLYDGKLIYRFYATINDQEPYFRSLELSKELSELMKYRSIKNEDIKIEKTQDITIVNICNKIFIPIDFDALIVSEDVDSMAKEFVSNLKTFLLVNDGKKVLKQEIGKRIVVEQGYTAIGEIANILIDGELKFTIYSSDEKGRTPYTIALDFANILNKYIETGVSVTMVNSEIAYGQYYLLIGSERALCINKEAEFLGVEKDKFIVEYINKVFGILLK
jgi:hypothetical protein